VNFCVYTGNRQPASIPDTEVQTLLPHPCLALTTLALASLLAAHSAPAQEVDAHEAVPAGPASNDTAPLLPSDLPDDPSAAPQQIPGQSRPGSSPAPNSGPLSSEEQLQQQEHQRVFGVMAAFNTTANRDALPMTPGQKFQLFFRSQTDP
jgi:hypothetical protein